MKPDSPKPSTRPLWAMTVLALVAIAVCAVVFVERLDRLEDQINYLAAQAEQTQRNARQASDASQAAIRQSSQAQASAQQAVVERDQAQKAEAESKQQAQAALNQAALAQQQAEQYRQQREAELNRLQQVLGQIADTRRTAMGLIMTLGSNSIRFDFDKSDLRPENREILSRIAGILMTLRGYQISVYGYTDDIGTQEYNLKLSDRRAQAVRDYLVKAGLDPKIMTWKGFGKSDPRVPGNSPAARAANRRVEIAIVDHRLQVQGVAPPGK